MNWLLKGGDRVNIPFFIKLGISSTIILFPFITNRIAVDFFYHV